MLIALSVLTVLWFVWLLYFAWESTKSSWDALLAGTICSLSLLLGAVIFVPLCLVWWFAH